MKHLIRHLAAFLLPALLLFVVSGCTDNDPGDAYSVSGRVLISGEPVSSALVSVGGLAETQTTADGTFKLLNVPRGNHALVISKGMEDGGFVERKVLIAVDGNTDVSDQTLPSPVLLEDPAEVTEQTMHLAWNSSGAPDFREYKLYRHSSSGLDESTGDLVHVSTVRQDTSFTVTGLDPLTDYYFRVYVMNDIGRLGGSNIVSARSENREIIKNGGFESLDQSTGFAQHWRLNASNSGFTVDDAIARSGNYSVVTENSGGNFSQQINPADLVAGSRYKLDFWIKHDEFIGMSDEFAVMLYDDENSWRVYANVTRGPLPESDWKLYEYEFTAVNLNTANINLSFYFFFISNYSEESELNVRAWIDDVSLTRID